MLLERPPLPHDIDTATLRCRQCRRTALAAFLECEAECDGERLPLTHLERWRKANRPGSGSDFGRT